MFHRFDKDHESIRIVDQSHSMDKDTHKLTFGWEFVDILVVDYKDYSNMDYW